MASALDYMDWRGDLSFTACPANEIDYMLISHLAVPDYSEIVDASPVSVHDASHRFFELHSDDKGGLGILQTKGVLPMLKKMADCPRFKDILLCDYVNEISNSSVEQFSAVTALLPDGTMCVCYRGTDDTIIGWKENFNLAVMDAVPAQKSATEYLERVSAGFCGDIVTCGHSKGGNLSVYAAVNASDSVRSRLVAAYSFDGPGFRESFITSDGYRETRDKIVTLIPQHSTVGTLLNLAGKQVIVKSNVKGTAAHDCFNWEALGTSFVRMEELSAGSRAFKTAICETLEGMTMENTIAFIDEFFGILLSTGATTLTELASMKPSSVFQMLKTLKDGKRVSEFAEDVLEKTLKAIVPLLMDKDD